MATDAELAASAMQVGLRRLLDRHPLLGGLVAQWRIAASDIGTMGVCWEGDRIALLYDPAFVRAITRDQLVGVLMHEVRHVVYGHCFMDPADWPDWDALRIAQEVTVNEGLDGLPGQPIVLSDYPQLPPDTDTRERYGILATTDRPKAGSGDPTLDSHDGWRQMRENETMATAQIRSAVDKIMTGGIDLKDDADDLQRLRRRFPSIGNRSGSTMERLPQQTRDITVHELQRELETRPGWARTRGYRFDRPSRRAPHLLGVVPAIAPVRRKVKANAVVDTSGSIDGATLASISAILNRLADTAEWTVVECDAAIQREYPFSGTLDMAKGRGGTDFRPPLESAFLENRQTELVVYFTDGLGPAPRQQPQVDVIWALTKNGRPPAPWGLVLRVES